MSAKFEPGRVYHCRSLQDYTSIFSFEIARRTSRFVWIKSGAARPERRKIFRTWNGAEAVTTEGPYSSVLIAH